MRNKTHFKRMLILILVLTVVSANFAYAFAETLEGYSISTSLDTSGNTIDLIVKVDSNPGLQSLKFALSYDLTKLKLVDTQGSEAFPGDLVNESETDENGNIIWNPQNKEEYPVFWIWDGSNRENTTESVTTATGTIATFRFMPTNNVVIGEELQINVIDAEACHYFPGDSEQNVIGSIAVTNNATYTVTGFNVTGTISTPISSSTTGALEGATVEILNGTDVIKSTTTDANGAYTIPAVTSGTYTLKVSKDRYAAYTEELVVSGGLGEVSRTVNLLGDIDHNGVVSANDLTLLARHVGKISRITDAYTLKVADVYKNNGESIVDANDLTKLARYVGRIISSL